MTWTNSDHEASGELVVADAGVVLVPQMGALAALDLSSGKTLWNESGLGSPSILRATKDQAVVGLRHLNRVEFRDLKTGKLTGKIEIPNPGAIPSEAAVVGDLLLLACPRIGIFAYRADKLVWQVKLKEEQYWPRLLGANSSLCLIMPNGDEEVQALTLKEGKKAWSGPIVYSDGYGLAADVWVTRRLDPKTRVVELGGSDANTGKSLWKKQLPGPHWISVNDKRVAVLSEA